MPTATKDKPKTDSITAGFHGGSVTVSLGDRSIPTADGQQFGSIACGEHNAVPVTERAKDDKPATPAGFQPGCEACETELASTLDQALRQGVEL